MASMSTKEAIVTSFVTIFLLVAILVIYLTCDPTYPKFRVVSATFSELNATASELTATWNLTFRVTNPNHKFSASCYDPLKVWVQHGDRFTLNTVHVPPFSLQTRKQTTVTALLRVVGAYVGDGVVSEILENGARGSPKIFEVRVFGRTRFRLWAYSKTGHLYLRCKSVEFVLSQNDGTTSSSGGPSTLCKYESYIV